MTKGKEQSYDSICFRTLLYEFDFSDKKEIEEKIKHRLTYYKLGNYNQERVNYLRQLKNDLYAETSLHINSKYYLKPKLKYADLGDFDLDRMIEDYVKKYEKTDKNEMKEFVSFAIYLYYMR